MGGHWNEAPIKEGMFLGGYVSFALRGKFSQLDFNQFITFADKDSAWGICSLNRESACIYYYSNWTIILREALDNATIIQCKVGLSEYTI